MNQTKTIALAGGCFWGVEEYYRRLKGIIDTKVGYAQGSVANPSYEEVCTGLTNHAETVLITYDPDIISLEMIADHLFRIIDPTSLNRQGNDVGTQYRTGIYPNDPRELDFLKAWIFSQKDKFKKPVVVEVELLRDFFEATEEHQLYLAKNPFGYCHVDFSKIKPDELKERR